MKFPSSKSSKQKDPTLITAREVKESKSPNKPPKVPILLYPQAPPSLDQPAHACVSWAQYQAPALASPAQRLVVGVVVVGGRHCSPTTGCTVGGSPAAMAPELLLLLAQLLWGYGHLHRLAVPARPAPPRAARRPRPYHASDPGNALLLQRFRQDQREKNIARSCCSKTLNMCELPRRKRRRWHGRRREWKRAGSGLA